MTEILKKNDYVQIPLQKCTGNIDILSMVEELLNAKTRNYSVEILGGIMTIKHKTK